MLKLQKCDNWKTCVIGLELNIDIKVGDDSIIGSGKTVLKDLDEADGVIYENSN